MKPGFYMLAKHGPWSHHVRVKGTDEMNEAVMWLARQGKIEDRDFEILVEHIEHKNTKKVFAIPKGQSMGKTSASMIPRIVNSVEPIIFVNEVKLATYIKLTWGGQ